MNIKLNCHLYTIYDVCHTCTHRRDFCLIRAIVKDRNNFHSLCVEYFISGVIIGCGQPRGLFNEHHFKMKLAPDG